MSGKEILLECNFAFVRPRKTFSTIAIAIAVLSKLYPLWRNDAIFAYYCMVLSTHSNFFLTVGLYIYLFIQTFFPKKAHNISVLCYDISTSFLGVYWLTKKTLPTLTKWCYLRLAQKFVSSIENIENMTILNHIDDKTLVNFKETRRINVNFLEDAQFFWLYIIIQRYNCIIGELWDV